MQLIDSLKQFLKLEEYYYCQKIIKNHLSENLVMSAEDEERFQLSNSC